MAKIIDISTKKDLELPEKKLPETTGDVLAMMVEDPGLKTWLKKVLKEGEDAKD